MSLAESVVALTLLSLLVLLVLNLFPSALTTVNYSRQKHVATVTAHDALEILASRDFSSLTLGTQTLNSLSVPSGFTLALEVSEVSGYRPEFLKRIVALVSWEQRGKIRTVRQELYVHSIRK